MNILLTHLKNLLLNIFRKVILGASLELMELNFAHIGPTCNYANDDIIGFDLWGSNSTLEILPN